MKNYLQLLFVFFITIQIQAQEKIITGNVSDSTGPLPGVIVIVKGTTNGTQTDFDGNYSIDGVSANEVLVHGGIWPVAGEYGLSLFPCPACGEN